jgi:protoporphyrinogen oxidase
MVSPATAARAARIVVLGAGPCGLACADMLDRLGRHDWVVLEAAESPGGLASSVLDAQGFTWDLGGHVVFSHFGEFDRLLAELFEPGELLHHDRSSFVRFRDRWVPYPFQQHLSHLPSPDAAASLLSLTWTKLRQRAWGTSDEEDFAHWLCRAYGPALVTRFFEPYNTKVWSTPPHTMSAGWVAERVAPATLRETWGALARPAAQRGQWGPNSTFAFPSCGGTGEVWRRMADRLGERVRTGARVQGVNPEAGLVLLADGESVPYDYVVSTLPLDQLAAMTTTAPPEVRHAAAQLSHTTVAMVGLGYQAPTSDQRSWLYFPEPQVPFYRATNFSKYAPANVPQADTGRFSAWMTETSLAPGTPVDTDELARACDAALREHHLVPQDAALASVHVEMIPYAYPVPTLDRDRLLHHVVPWLESQRIYPRGRFGTWRYEIGNMDHAVKMGMDIARRLITGTPEDLLPPALLPGSALVGSPS